MSRRAILRGMVLGAVAAPLGACSATPDYPIGQLRIATGGKGGVYYAYGQGIATAVRKELPGLAPEVIETAASVDNLRMLASDDAQLAFTLADVAAAAVRGQEPFSDPLPISALARLYDNYLHLVVRRSGRISKLGDLRGRRVCLGAIGSGTELVAERVLDAERIDPRTDIKPMHHNVEDSARELQAGRLDAFFFSGGLPVTAIADLSEKLQVRLIDLGYLAPELRRRHGEFYAERTIPASTYHLGAPVSSLGVPSYLAVAQAMDSRLAFQLTRLLFDRRDVLTASHPEARRLYRGSAIGTYPLLLHPGAAEYYRDAKR